MRRACVPPSIPRDCDEQYRSGKDKYLHQARVSQRGDKKSMKVGLPGVPLRPGVSLRIPQKPRIADNSLPPHDRETDKSQDYCYRQKSGNPLGPPLEQESEQEWQDQVVLAESKAKPGSCSEFGLFDERDPGQAVAQEQQDGVLSQH